MYSENLKSLGITIPAAPLPLAAYVPAVKTGKYVYTSGQLPMKDGKLAFAGRVGADVSQDEGKVAAEICGINCLSAALTVIGDIDKIERIVKLTAFINSAAGFTSQPEVANGASELMIKIFGDNGKHARSAVGVSELPRNAAVEIEMILEVKE